MDPNTTHEAGGAADDETAEDHLYDASLACRPWDIKRGVDLRDLHDLRIPENSAEFFEVCQYGSCHSVVTGRHDVLRGS